MNYLQELKHNTMMISSFLTFSSPAKRHCVVDIAAMAWQANHNAFLVKRKSASKQLSILTNLAAISLLALRTSFVAFALRVNLGKSLAFDSLAAMFSMPTVSFRCLSTGGQQPESRLATLTVLAANRISCLTIEFQLFKRNYFKNFILSQVSSDKV